MKWVYVGGWFEVGWPGWCEVGVWGGGLSWDGRKETKLLVFHDVILQIIYSKKEKNFCLSES